MLRKSKNRKVSRRNLFMKILISATGPSLDSEVDPRFGRCQYFIVVDLEDMSFEALPNTNLGQGSGVGIQSAKVVADQGAGAVITGNIGPNAQDVLSEVGVDVITGVSGTVREAAQQYKTGELQLSHQPNAQNVSVPRGGAKQSLSPRPSQAPNIGSGIGRGMGMGRGMGGGRGMKCGCGLGGGRSLRTGRGMGRAPYTPTAMTSSGEMTREDELACLHEDARVLREQMEAIERRIKELEKKKP
jgi:predicted Fe-Mo cluster-binding NifX family protein